MLPIYFLAIRQCCREIGLYIEFVPGKRLTAGSFPDVIPLRDWLDALDLGARIYWDDVSCFSGDLEQLSTEMEIIPHDPPPLC